MSVLVQFGVAGADPARMKKAVENMPEFQREPGFLGYPGAYVAESDPTEVTELELWESHDHMHASSEKYGEQFNAEAGTEGLDWKTWIWHRVAGDDLQPVADPRVLVQFIVTVPDVEQFRAAWEEARPLFWAHKVSNLPWLVEKNHAARVQEVLDFLRTGHATTPRSPGGRRGSRARDPRRR